MRYSLEPKYRKYIHGYCQTASKRVVQKTGEATGGVIGNKVADKITSLGKSKS